MSSIVHAIKFITQDQSVSQSTRECQTPRADLLPDSEDQSQRLAYITSKYQMKVLKHKLAAQPIFVLTFSPGMHR